MIPRRSVYTGAELQKFELELDKQITIVSNVEEFRPTLNVQHFNKITINLVAVFSFSIVSRENWKLYKNQRWRKFKLNLKGNWIII